MLDGVGALVGVGIGVWMVGGYALEARHVHATLVFALGCFVAALYAFATGSWLFVWLEAIWGGIALHRWTSRRAVSSALEGGSTRCTPNR